MLPIKRIVCPIDLSEESARTLRYAITMARTYEARLLVCHCPKSKTDGDEEFIQRIRLLVTQASLTVTVAQTETPFLWGAFLLHGGSVGSAIVDFAATQSADLILMRSRRRPLAATLLGSTAEAIAYQAPCPVLVMHADEREWISDSTGAIHLKSLLVALDFSSNSELALHYGFALGQQFQSEIHLLHVLSAAVSEAEIRWVGQETNAPYHQAARRLQDAVPGEVHLWSKVTHVVRSGRPYREILAYAAANEVDLICMGAHGSEFSVSDLLGSNVDRVLRQAKCPVLIAHGSTYLVSSS